VRRGEQERPHQIRRAEVRLRQPWRNRDAQAHAPDFHAARAVSQPAGDQMIDTRRRRQHHIDGFLGLEPLDHSGGIRNGQSDRDRAILSRWAC